MESQLSTLLVVSFIGFVLTVNTVLVESQNAMPETDRNRVKSKAPPPVSSPPPPRRRSPPDRESPPPPHKKHKHRSHSHHRKIPPQPPPPPPAKETLNTGKKVGLLFAGMAAMLQVFVAGFLVHKRRQLL